MLLSVEVLEPARDGRRAHHSRIHGDVGFDSGLPGEQLFDGR